MLSEAERAELQSLANSRTLSHALVVRAQIIVLSADGMFNKVIAQRLGVSHQTVGKWRKRFLEGGVQGLYDELRSGRPRSISDEQVAALVMTTLQTEPRSATQWSVRSSGYRNRIWLGLPR